MTATVSVPTERDLRERLKWLARHWTPAPSIGLELLLAAVVHESLDGPVLDRCPCGRCLGCLWDAYLGDLALADDWDAGRVDWRDINPDLTCPDKEGAAADEIAERVAGTEDILLRGWPAPRAVKACA